MCLIFEIFFPFGLVLIFLISLKRFFIHAIISRWFSTYIRPFLCSKDPIITLNNESAIIIPTAKPTAP